MMITKDKLTIRNAETKDAKLLCNWWNDGEIMAHAGFPNGLNTTIEKVSDIIASNTDDTSRRLIIDIEGKSVGEMSYSNQGQDVAEMGIKICDTSVQDQGLGSQFISMLINYLFEIGYTKIILDTNLKNLRAQHVYEKLGFTKVRVNIDSWTDQLGVLQSAVDYELLKTNWVKT